MLQEVCIWIMPHSCSSFVMIPSSPLTTCHHLATFLPLPSLYFLLTHISACPTLVRRVITLLTEVDEQSFRVPQTLRFPGIDFSWYGPCRSCCHPPLLPWVGTLQVGGGVDLRGGGAGKLPLGRWLFLGWPPLQWPLVLLPAWLGHNYYTISSLIMPFLILCINSTNKVATWRLISCYVAPNSLYHSIKSSMVGLKAFTWTKKQYVASYCYI